MLTTTVTKKRLVFVCKRCGAERNGMDKKQCPHLYRDYIVKEGKVWEKKFGYIAALEPKVEEDGLPF